MALAPVRVDEQTHEVLSNLRRELSVRFRRDVSAGEIVALFVASFGDREHDQDLETAIRELLRRDKTRCTS